MTPAQDGPLSPDNVTVTKRAILVNEDGTAGAAPPGTGTGSRDDMDRRNRDGSIWVVPLKSAGDPSTFTRVAELIGRAEGGWDDILTVDSRGNRAGSGRRAGSSDRGTRSARTRSYSTCRRIRRRRRPAGNPSTSRTASC